MTGPKIMVSGVGDGVDERCSVCNTVMTDQGPHRPGSQFHDYTCPKGCTSRMKVPGRARANAAFGAGKKLNRWV